MVSLDFAIMKQVLLLLQRKATAPLAVRLASAKIYNLSGWSTVLLVGKYCLEICWHLASWMFSAISSHCCWSSSDRGSSQSKLCCHKDCMNIFALTVTGDSHPRGSNTLADFFNTSLFVIRDLILGMDDFNVSDNVSSCVFHCNPKMFTGLLVSTNVVSICSVHE